MLQCIFRQCIIIGTVISDRWMVGRLVREVARGIASNGMDPGTKLQMNGHKELITLAVVSVLVAVLKIELCFVQEEGYIFHMSIVVGDWLIE